MSVKELIEKLQNLEKRGYGDWKVEVQYRDDGGSYYGSDEHLLMDIDVREERIVL